MSRLSLRTVSETEPFNDIAQPTIADSCQEPPLKVYNAKKIKARDKKKRRSLLKDGG